MSKKTGNSAPAAGWYPDPESPGEQQRYWDGNSWTEHTHKPDAPASPPTSAPTSAPIQAAEPSRDSPLSVKGVSGQVEFDGHFVTIRRQGFAARATIGKGDKRLPISLITAVQWKPPGPMVNGFIQFTVGGSNERRSAFGHQTMSAVRDENSIVFARKHLADFEHLRALVEDAIAASHQPFTMPVSDAPSVATPSSPGPSVVDQLRDLGELHAKGIVDDGEFAQLKAQLLAGP